MNNVLGPSIKVLRKQKRMTQLELSKLTGFSQNTISNHENAKRSLDELDISKYAKALNVTPQDLFNLATNSSKDENDINVIYSQLNSTRKLVVFEFAEDQLVRQRTEKNNIATLPKAEPADDLLAAHSPDPNRKYSPEELEAIKDFADKEIEKYNKKNNL